MHIVKSNMIETTHFLISALFMVSARCELSISRAFIQDPQPTQQPSQIFHNSYTTSERSIGRASDHERVQSSPLRSPILKQRYEKIAEWLDNIITKHQFGHDETVTSKPRGTLLSSNVADLNIKDEPVFVRFRKSMLSRMPMSFGKKSFPGSHNDRNCLDHNDPIPGHGHLNTGSNKFNDTEDNSNEYEGIDKFSANKENFTGSESHVKRQRRDQLRRMTMAFGKRQQKEVSSQQNEDAIPGEAGSEYYKTYDEHNGCESDVYPSSDKCSNKTNKEIGASSAVVFKTFNQDDELEGSVDRRKDNTDPTLKKDRSLLLAFKYSNEDQEYNNNSKLRGYILKMFKERFKKYPDSEEKSHSENIHYILTTKRRFNGLPVSFEKRKERNKINSKLLSDNFIKSKNKDTSSILQIKNDHEKDRYLFKILTSKIDEITGDRRVYVSSKTKQLLDQLLLRGQTLNRLARSKLERMPLNYGRRSSSDMNIPGNTNNLQKIFKRSKIYYITRRVDLRLKNKSKSPAVIKRPILNKMALTFGKRMKQPVNIQEIIKRPRLNKMPLTFGKRLKNSNDVVEMMKRPRLSKMPLTFGKRLKNSNDAVEIIKRPRLNKMPLTFGKRLKNSNDVLEMMKRPRLNKMPLTFGKRLKNSNDVLEMMKRPRLNKMPLTFGKRLKNSNDVLEMMKRPRLNKMPLTYGKSTAHTVYSLPPRETPPRRDFKSDSMLREELDKKFDMNFSGRDHANTFCPSSWVVSANGLGLTDGRQKTSGLKQHRKDEVDH